MYCKLSEKSYWPRPSFHATAHTLSLVPSIYPETELGMTHPIVKSINKHPLTKSIGYY